MLRLCVQTRSNYYCFGGGCFDYHTKVLACFLPYIHIYIHSTVQSALTACVKSNQVFTVSLHLHNTTQKYKLCTKAYLADGKDGYEVFKSASVLVSD